MYRRPRSWRGRLGGNSQKHRKRTHALAKASAVESLENRLYLTASYIWQNVNIGAGGFVDGIFYDPNNQNTIYARTDIGGLYKSVNDGTTWSQLLDWVGNTTGAAGNGTNYQDIGVLSFAIDPENSNNIYADVGMYTGTDGEVLYSTNGGQTWGQTPLSFYVGGNSNGRGDGEQIQVDPNDSNIIFLGSNNDGLWESTNAGHSFSKVSSFSPSSTTFVLFNPAGTAGSPSQTIYVGIDSTSSGTNLYQTTNGGTTWAQITGTGTLPTKYLPGHGVISGGYIYLGYANAEAPNGSITNGGVYRYDISTGVWASISPKATGGSFGYDGVAADPENPNTVVVTSFDYYSGPDQIWRTVNANAATPTWTELYDFASAQDSGYEGYDNTRNTTNAPWTAAFGDGISNWAAAVAINPFNSNQLMYGTGQGIWATNNASNGGTNTQLTAANSWYFPDTGIEFTAVGGVAAPTAGVPLYSAMGDIGGFANTTLMFSPAQGSVLGSGYATDYAGQAPQDAVMVGSMGTEDGIYTTNGLTFSNFATNPGGSTEYDEGTVAISANGSTIVWAPTGQTAYYTTNDGSTWTASTLTGGGALPTGGVIVSDKVNPNYFYYWTNNSSDNSWTLYISSNAGQTFTASAGGAIGTGNTTLAVNPYVAGQLWLGSYIGIYESTNFGASFTHIGSTNTDVFSNTMAVGAPAPGATTPAIYFYGTLTSGGFEGIYRSDDGGNTWVLLNSASQQWGGLIQTMAADPNVFGRVYLGINGRGVIMGNPASSLPTGWIDTDINEPGNPGWATSSTTLSSGAVSDEWNVAGGGIGLAGAPVAITSLSVTSDVATAISTTANHFQVGEMVTITGATNSVYDGTFVITGLANTAAGISAEIGAATEFTFALNTANGTASGTIIATPDDQFNYAYDPVSGNATISAELMGLTNADNGSGTPQAGVMFRASTNPDDVFFELAQTSAGSLLLEYRTTTGGSVTTQTLTGVPVGSEYLEIIRNGSNFSAEYSSNGTAWTQLGSTVSITAMPSTANAGLAASASYNPQLTDATFTNVVIGTGLTVSQAAAANPSPVTGTTTTLTALGSENGSGSGLNYTWSATSVPAGVANPTYSVNGTNAASTTLATFYGAGSYTFMVTISDAGNNTVTSSVNVVVQQTVSNVAVSPSNSPVVPVGLSQQFSATATDQFGNSITSPSFTWGISGSGNSISGTGDATLGSTPGSFTVTATGGGVQGSATVIAENFAVPSGSTLDINLGSAGAVALSGSGSNITAIQNGVQITLSGFTAITVADTGSGDTLNFNGGITLPFSFSNTGSSTVNVNSGTLTIAEDMGGTINIGTLSIADRASAAMTAATSNSPTTLSVNTLSVGSNAQFDVANNVVLINYGAGSDPIDAIAGSIASGYFGGSWNGPGIISSTAETNPNYGLGYADAADVNNPANLPTGQIKIMYTLLGDANLDGDVNGGDFTIMASHFNQSVTNGWDEGDFNYNGSVNGADFTLLATNFNQSAQIAAVESGAVDEPAAPVATASSPSPTTPSTTSDANQPTTTSSTVSSPPTGNSSSPAAAVTQTNSTSPNSEDSSDSNDVVNTILGKQGKQKSRHGGRG